MNILDYVCHRLPERSFFIKDYQFPVCARCTGGYLGIILMNLVYLLIPISISLRTAFIAISLAVPAIVDGGTQFIGLRESNNILRFITGLLLGFGIVIFFKYIKYSLFLGGFYG